MHSNYVNSNPADIECLIQSVLSSAGGTGTDRTGWIYQVGSTLYGSKPGFAGTCGTSGKVYANAEVWYGSTQRYDSRLLDLRGTYTSIRDIMHTMEWINNNTQVKFTAKVYYTNDTLEYTIGTYTKSNYNDNSSYFMAGRTTWNNYKIKFLQFGVESWASGRYVGGWNIREAAIGFYDSASNSNKDLGSMLVRATQGDKAYITWLNGSSTPTMTGGEKFLYTSVSVPNGGVANWRYDANNRDGIVDESILWR